MPYIQTSAYFGFKTGQPLVRPLFYEFPRDPNVGDIYEQFMLGDSILVSPSLAPGRTQYLAYFPYGTWYGTWTGQILRGTNDWVYLEDNPYMTQSHIRAGSIVPLMVNRNRLRAATKAKFPQNPQNLRLKTGNSGPISGGNFRHEPPLSLRGPQL